MPDESLPWWTGAGLGATITAAAAAALAWFRAGKTQGRIERRDALKEWQCLHDKLLARFDEQQSRSDDNRTAIITLKSRVDECEEKHEECRKQHEECEQKYAEVCTRLDSLEDSIKRP